MLDASEQLERAERSLRRAHLDVWSKRVSLPPPPPGVDVRTLVSAALNLDESLMISIGGFLSSDARLREIKDALSSGLFAHAIVASREDLGRLAELLIDWSAEEPENLTRFALDFHGGEFVSPYFPISRSPPAALEAPMLTVALLYVEDAEGALRRGGLAALEEMLIDFSERIRGALSEVDDGRARLRGIDFSLSPWMESSVAKVIEAYGRCRLEGGRCIPVVRDLNRALNSERLRPLSTGFNELMLPVAEDEALKLKAKTGSMRVADLLLYVPVCLAGLDMVAFRAGRRDLLTVLDSLYCYSEVKRRPLGFRGIPVEPEEKVESIETSVFGEIPVIEL
ncbi:MAG: DUF711 family protein [Fervidicoccaceae archaeon]